MSKHALDVSVLIHDHQVTLESIRLVLGTVPKGDEPVWHFSDIQKSIFKTDLSIVTVGDHVLVQLIVTPNERENFCLAWVYKHLAEWIKRTAHLVDPELAQINQQVKDAYRALGADIRGNDAVALLVAPIGIVVYKGPVLATNILGTTIDHASLVNGLDRYVPKSVQSLISDQIKLYFDRWESIYGTKPDLRFSITYCEAGEHARVMIGTEQQFVLLQINKCYSVAVDTLKPTEYIRSTLRDFC